MISCKNGIQWLILGGFSVVRIDAIVDAVVDAMVDAIVDAAVDAMVGGMVDAIIDAVVDATLDAMVDETVDALTLDAMVDGMVDAIVDATVDAMVDAMVDVMDDATLDATVDVMVGGMVDAVVDAMVDAMVGGMGDAVVDAIVDARVDATQWLGNSSVSHSYKHFGGKKMLLLPCRSTSLYVPLLLLQLVMCWWGTPPTPIALFPSSMGVAWMGFFVWLMDAVAVFSFVELFPSQSLRKLVAVAAVVAVVVGGAGRQGRVDSEASARCTAFAGTVGVRCHEKVSAGEDVLRPERRYSKCAIDRTIRDKSWRDTMFRPGRWCLSPISKRTRSTHLQSSVCSDMAYPIVRRVA